MVPCKFCGPVDERGRVRRGVRQVGKTKYQGNRYRRRYRCLDCGAVVVVTGEVPPTSDVWTRTN
jgi:transcription elongation factor Elf1